MAVVIYFGPVANKTCRCGLLRQKQEGTAGDCRICKAWEAGRGVQSGHSLPRRSGGWGGGGSVLEAEPWETSDIGVGWGEHRRPMKLSGMKNRDEIVGKRWIEVFYQSSTSGLHLQTQTQHLRLDKEDTGFCLLRTAFSIGKNLNLCSLSCFIYICIDLWRQAIEIGRCFSLSMCQHHPQRGVGCISS